jgi:aspartate racemase
MKTIGLLGGMSWESTLEYYRVINETVKEKLGDFHSAKCVLYSVDFAELERLQHQGRWEEATELMVDAAQKVKNAGADFIVICANTMHKLADDIQNSIHMPLLHIADVTAEKIKAQGVTKVGLLGTKFTMEEDFYRKRLTQKYGLEVIIPEEAERQFIHKILYDEKSIGEMKRLSKDTFKSIIENLAARGAQGVILGCTEIPLLVDEEDYALPLFDTTLIHAQIAVEYALGEYKIK